MSYDPAKLKEINEARRKRRIRDRIGMVIAAVAVIALILSVGLPEARRSMEEEAARVPLPVTVTVRAGETPAGTLAETWRATIDSLPDYVHGQRVPMCAGDPATGFVVTKAQGELEKSPLLMVSPAGEVTELPIEGGWPYVLRRTEAGGVALVTRPASGSSVSSFWLDASLKSIWSRQSNEELVTASAVLLYSDLFPAPDGSALVFSYGTPAAFGQLAPGVYAVPFDGGSTWAGKYLVKGSRWLITSADWDRRQVLVATASVAGLNLQLLAADDLSPLASGKVPGASGGGLPGLVPPSITSFTGAAGKPAWWINALGWAHLVDSNLEGVASFENPLGRVYVTEDGWCGLASDNGATLVGPDGEVAWTVEGRSTRGIACAPGGEFSLAVHVGDAPGSYTLEAHDLSGQVLWSRDISGVRGEVPVLALPALGHAVALWSDGAVFLTYDTATIQAEDLALETPLAYTRSAVLGGGKYLLVEGPVESNALGRAHLALFYDLSALTRR